jgi:hypothetical protein
VSDANTYIQCNILSEKTEKLKPGSAMVTIHAPDYAVKDLVLNLDKLGITTLTGLLMDSTNKGVGNKEITLSFLDKTLKLTTDKAGAWS